MIHPSALLRTRSTAQQALVFGTMVMLAALAWVATVALPTTQLAGYLTHTHTGALGHSAQSPAVAAPGLFLLGWTVMAAAMMLPTALPMVSTFARLTQQRSGGSRRVTLFVVGYLSAWVGFGVLAYAADLMVHLAVASSPFLASHTSLIGGGVLILAGMYQYTPLKSRCLHQCRSAVSFLMSSWREGWRGAWAMGAHHGIFCVGCCWALMLVMLGLGMAQLAWMLGLALLMFVEKVMRGGESVGRLTSPVLMALGVLTAAGPGVWS